MLENTECLNKTRETYKNNFIYTDSINLSNVLFVIHAMFFSSSSAALAAKCANRYAVNKLALFFAHCRLALPLQLCVRRQSTQQENMSLLCPRTMYSLNCIFPTHSIA